MQFFIRFLALATAVHSAFGDDQCFACTKPTGCSGRTCDIVGGCGLGVPVGYYPDLTRSNSYCYCTGTVASSRYETCNPLSLDWDTHLQGSNYYLTGNYGKDGLWGTNGGGCNWPGQVSSIGKERPGIGGNPIVTDFTVDSDGDICGAPTIPPTPNPTLPPTPNPTMPPTPNPTIPPTPNPTMPPTPNPTMPPTPNPTMLPTPNPTMPPTPNPTMPPTPNPTMPPMPNPTIPPTPNPTIPPTPNPTIPPTPNPTIPPTPNPTMPPSPDSTLSPTPNGGASGDPHFKTWSGERYDFHGICDLILLRNSKFNNNLGMVIYIRSKKTKRWSYISTAVIRIGAETFEVSGRKDGDTHWINGIEGDSNGDDILWEERTSIAGYPITYQRLHLTQREYVINLGKNSAKIIFKTWKDFVRVDVVNPREEDFTGSLGLMGSYPAGSRLGRFNPSSSMKDMNAFGQEWQVQSSDPQLFHSVEGPQYPSLCEIQSKTSLRRRLSKSEISREEADILCLNISDKEERNLCIFDVMVTSDRDTAKAY